MLCIFAFCVYFHSSIVHRILDFLTLCCETILGGGGVGKGGAQRRFALISISYKDGSGCKAN